MPNDFRPRAGRNLEFVYADETHLTEVIDSTSLR